MPALKLLQRIEARTLKENVSEVLRRLIIDGTLASGSEFNQAQIAEQLGVSRGPIREALGKLENEGLLLNVPYKGVIVTSLTEKYVKELYSVRTALELLALEHSIESLTGADLEYLEEVVERMRAAASTSDLTRLGELDLNFHVYLLTKAEHELVLNLWLNLEVGIRRCLARRHKVYTYLDEVVGSHPQLITALKARDKISAKQILSDHIAESLQYVLTGVETPET